MTVKFEKLRGESQDVSPYFLKNDSQISEDTPVNSEPYAIKIKK